MSRISGFEVVLLRHIESQLSRLWHGFLLNVAHQIQRPPETGVHSGFCAKEFYFRHSPQQHSGVASLSGERWVFGGGYLPHKLESSLFGVLRWNYGTGGILVPDLSKPTLNALGQKSQGFRLNRLSSGVGPKGLGSACLGWPSRTKAWLVHV